MIMEKTPENIMAIDSSTSVLRVGLKISDGDIIAQENKNRFRHAEYIFKMIDDLLKAGSIGKNDLNAVIISTGPGSFTGLRVGMSAAKGLASALDIPLVGLSTFSAVAKSIFENFGRTAVLIPSRRDEFYFGLIKSTEFENDSIGVLKSDEIGPKLDKIGVYGIDFDISTLSKKSGNSFKIIDHKMGIADLMAAGIKKLETKGGDDLFLIEPFYVQNFPVKRPK